MQDKNMRSPNFYSTLEEHNLAISPVGVQIMQVNITSRCNQSCIHCHVDASPGREEEMSPEVIYKVIEIIESTPEIEILDITGGAPEFHPLFGTIIKRGSKLNKRVMVRHNLTITFEGNHHWSKQKNDLAYFFAENNVEVVASLPYYQEYFTDKQRGPGVFLKSIKALRILNEVGYGRKDSGMILNLVYNPAGAFLPADQSALETDFRRELQASYGICFNRLYTITNMPVGRFKTRLESSGTYCDYIDKLKSAFNPQAAKNVMCRNQVSVGYDGKMYDCDFNQMLGLQIAPKRASTVFDFDYGTLINRDIIFGVHCYGCTAGAGSSCGGATT